MIEKTFFTPVFSKQKIQELSITYFHNKLVYINLLDHKFGYKFLEIQNFQCRSPLTTNNLGTGRGFLKTRNFPKMRSDYFYEMGQSTHSFNDFCTI